jgi:hypothetical protein
MRPAFSSTRQAIGFSLLLGTIIVLPAILPVLASKTGWLKVRERYPSTIGAYVEHQVFAETNSLDIAFVGTSRIWTAINTPYVQQKLSEHLHRDAEAVTLGWSFAGCDVLYFVARDLIEHRRVRLLVVGDEVQLELKPGTTSPTYRRNSRPHRASYTWFWRGEDTQALRLLQLPPKEKLSLYGEAIIDLPHYLFDVGRPNLLSLSEYYRPFVADRGAGRQHKGWGHNPEMFFPYDPRRALATPSDVVTFSSQTQKQFAFDGPSWDAYQLYFARRLVRLCLDHGTKLMAVHLPVLAEAQQSVIQVPTRWTEDLGTPVELIGIPGAKLFVGYSPDEVRKYFYCDDWHLNQNGEDLFTPLITPALLEFYDETARHS